MSLVLSLCSLVGNYSILTLVLVNVHYECVNDDKLKRFTAVMESVWVGSVGV